MFFLRQNMYINSSRRFVGKAKFHVVEDCWFHTIYILISRNARWCYGKSAADVDRSDCFDTWRIKHKPFFDIWFHIDADCSNSLQKGAPLISIDW